MPPEAMPPAELPRYDTDVEFSDELFDRIFVSAGLKSPGTAKFPGSMRLRRYQAGEAICRLGDEGNTAFYLLTAKDIANLLDFAEQAPAERPAKAKRLADLENELSVLRQRLEAAGEDAKARADVQKRIDSLERESAKLSTEIGSLDEILRLLDAGLKRDLRPPLLDDRERVKQQTEAAFAARRAESTGDADGTEWYEQMKQAPPAKKRLVADSLRRSDPELAALLLNLAQAEDSKRVLATANLPVARTPERRRPGWWQRLRQALGGHRAVRDTRPRHILSDGPTDIDFESREASMCEGDLFGEMSCLNRTPRSATVVAVADCYVLEMLRNILDALRRDKAYKDRTEKVLGERLINSYLLESPIFGMVGEEKLSALRGQMELVEYEAGSLIYDENDRADCMHLIVSGIAKVLVNASWLWKVDDISDWPALCSELVDAGKATGPARLVWDKLSPDARQAAETPAAGVPPETKRLVVDALNDLLKDPTLYEQDEFHAALHQHQLGQEAWRLLAHPRQGTAEEMQRCNRLLLEDMLPGIVRSGQVSGDGDVIVVLAEGDIADWKSLSTKLGGTGAKPGDLLGAAQRTLGRQLPSKSRLALADSTPDARSEVLAGLNYLLVELPWLLVAEVSAFVQSKELTAAKVQQFLPQKAQRRELWTSYAFDRFSRAMNRMVLEAVFPRGLGTSRRPAGPPTVLAYRARGEFIGEMGLLSGEPRSAACVAYNHPDNDPRREVGPVRLIRIGQNLFDRLCDEVPAFREHAENVAAQRRANTPRARAAAGEDLARSGRVEELGLIEGQRLMLIDLDRCTRCDECVQACVATHDDGRSRLFLDGPRLDHYLVPTTCRSCLDPVCLIGCPVGSIRRGDDKQILIEDWCIGCRQCARQCPYGSIQMHDVGLIPEGSPGWRYQSAAAVADDQWYRPGYRASRWPSGRAPFRYNPVFRATLNERAGGSVFFRYEFRLGREVTRAGSQFQITIVSTKEALPSACVWLNGSELRGNEKINRGGSDDPPNYHSREFLLPAEGPLLRAGNNVLAVRVTPPTNGEDIFFDARLDEEKQAAKGAQQKLVTLRAVVCDLCGELPSGPACVRACPHEAAMRVDARVSLPTR
jgi:Fe-S-cluster-containing hydrogenase component 2/CRP-like cAMP-binding protein